MSAPTIAAIEAIPLALPFRHHGPPAGFGGTTWTTLADLVVKVTDSDGAVGYGEAFGYNAIPATRAALETMVTPLAIGRPYGDIGALMGELARTLHLFGRSGPVIYALSGLDIALWDLLGKRAGLPLARLLGGGGRTHLPAYASLLRAGEDTALRTVCEALAGEGYQALKLHEVEPALVLAAREAIGPDRALMVDVNCPWDRLAACEAARAMLPADVFWLEEPLWPPEDIAGLAEVAAVGIPIAAGENVANAAAMAQLTAAPGLHHVQPSVTKVGGVSAMLSIARSVEAAGKRLAPHSPYFGPGLLATLQLAAVVPGIEWVEYFGVTLEAPLFGGLEMPDAAGNIAIPQGPGLGADPDPDVMRDCRVT